MKHGFKKGVNHHPGEFGYGTRIQEGTKISLYCYLFSSDKHSSERESHK